MLLLLSGLGGAAPSGYRVHLALVPDNTPEPLDIALFGLYV
jgi:hypothetical protein